MPAGIRVYGTHGVLQIDDVNLNLCLRQRGDLDTIPKGSLYLFSGGAFEVDAVYPVVATMCIYGVQTLLTRVATNRWRISVQCDGPPGTTIHWLLFDVPQSAGANYGLTVRNAAGEIVYNTSFKLFRASQRYEATDYLTLPGQVSLPPGKTYAVVSFRYAGGSERIFYEEGTNGYLVEDRTWVFLSNIQGTTLHMGPAEDYYNTFLSNATPLGWYYDRRHVDVMVIDITNY